MVGAADDACGAAPHGLAVRAVMPSMPFFCGRYRLGSRAFLSQLSGQVMLPCLALFLSASCGCVGCFVFCLDSSSRWGSSTPAAPCPFDPLHMLMPLLGQGLEKPTIDATAASRGVPVPLVPSPSAAARGGAAARRRRLTQGTTDDARCTHCTRPSIADQIRIQIDTWTTDFKQTRIHLGGRRRPA